MRVIRLGLGLLLCALCIFVRSSFASEEDADDVPLTKLGSKTGPTLKFFYCYSCGYKKIFEEYVSILQTKYPEIKIYGNNFNPPGMNMLIAKFLGTTKLILILLIISRYNITQWLRQPLLSFWQWCIENRLYACLMLFFICNAIESQLISSGAFEILLNDVPVWSKLETGRIPQPPELFQIIDNHMQMTMSDMDMNFNK